MLGCTQFLKTPHIDRGQRSFPHNRVNQLLACQRCPTLHTHPSQTRQAEEQEEERREVLVEQEKLNRLKDCWLSVLIDLLLPLASCPQQRIVLVSSLKEIRPPAPQTFDSLSFLIQAIQQQGGGGGPKKLVSEVEVRLGREEKKHATHTKPRLQAKVED